jgi:hypothetical protein
LGKWRVEGQKTWDVLVNLPHIPPGFRDEMPERYDQIYQWISTHKDTLMKATLEFHRFLLTDYVFGQPFITKNIEEAFTLGTLIDQDCKQGLAMTSLILSRRPKEYPYKVLAWYELVNRGVHPRMAVVLSEAAYENGNGNWDFYYADSGHQAFEIDEMTIEGLSALVRSGKVPNDKGDTPLREGYKYVNERFNGPGTKFYFDLSDLFTDQIEEEQQDKRTNWLGDVEIHTVKVVPSVEHWADYIISAIEELQV